MISGFNTDIEFGGVTYHIQTEDKGLKTPMILSLVYVGGSILASKRSPYDDLIESGSVDSGLEERVARQHKLICAAVRAGRIEDLKRMSMKEAGEPSAGLVARRQEVVTIKPESSDRPAEEDGKPDLREIPIPKPPSFKEDSIWEIPSLEDVEIVEQKSIDGNMIIEEEIILPPEAVKVIGDMGQTGPVAENELRVKILGNDLFRSGERKNINVLVCRGKEEYAISGAGIMVKVLGSDFRPQIFHSMADSNGIAEISVSIPEFHSGRAAVLVRAIVGNEEAEARRVISQVRR